MKDNNLVKRLIQTRIIEATKDNINGKLVCIAKNYGSPIIGSYYDTPFMEEDWSLEPTTDWAIDETDDGVLPRLGYIYDSLKLGTNLEIVVLAKDVINIKTDKKEMEKPTRVKCSYNGYTVYHEENGKLLCYAPFPQWRNHLEKIYGQAFGKDKRRIDEEKQKDKEVHKMATRKALGTLRRLWGI